MKYKTEENKVATEFQILHEDSESSDTIKKREELLPKNQTNRNQPMTLF